MYIQIIHEHAMVYQPFSQKDLIYITSVLIIAYNVCKKGIKIWLIN